MKIGAPDAVTGLRQEVEMFEEGNEETLHDMVQKYRVIKEMIQNKEIKIPPHDSGYVKAFNQVFHIELDQEEMLELRTFAEEDYDLYLQEKIYEDRLNGMKNIDLNQFI